MSERFLKLLTTNESQFLAKKHPNAFILLFFIAERARREDGLPDGLTIGQCYLGDWENMGLTRQQYRTALKVLEKRKIIEISETCRTRQKSTTGSTTVSTLVKLISSTVYDINPEKTNHPSNQRPTTDQPPTNHKEEGIRRKKKEEEENKAQTASQPRSKDSLSFDFEKGEYIGIESKDREQWKDIYTHISLEIEIAKSIQWIKANPSKSKKSLWRKFLNGWLQRANESAENKKAFQIARNANTDRKTKDKDGNPIQTVAAGRF